MPPSPEPRTLTQMLREWDDASLTRLLQLRSELAFPPPIEFSQLASRATTRHSVASALDGLTAAELSAAQIACETPTPANIADILATSGVEPGGAAAAELVAAVGRLRERGLLWGSDNGLRPVRALVGLLEVADDEGTDSGAATRRRSTLPLTPPDLSGLPTQRPSLVDKAAAGSAFEFVRRVEVVVEHSDHRPTRLTQSGTLASRDVRTLAQLLDVPVSLAAAHLELALVAGLLGMTAVGVDETLIPTDRFDTWRTADLADQWRTLADAWLYHHLGSGPAELKALLLDAFGDPSEGRVVAAPGLKAWIAWHRPRRPSSWDRAVPSFVSQAEAIGLTGLGALASYAVDPDVEALRALMPSRVDHVLLQADLTAVAPGPLHPDAASELAAVADVESHGSATVFRFTRESLARARMLGWSSDDILAALQKHSRTPVPQPLEYLVRDLDRPTGPPISAMPGAGPTITGADDGHGHRRPRRAAPKLADDDATAADRLDDTTIAEVIKALREHDGREAEVVDGGASESLGGVTIDTLREAVETQEVVWLGFVDNTGTRQERMAVVASVDDGVVRGVDSTTQAPLSIPISRLTAAHIIRSAASR